MEKPLAEKLRPKSLKDIVGQEHILGKSCLLFNLIKNGNIPNLIFYGPPGTGKTTTANIIAEKTNKRLFKINATTASLSDIKNIIAEINPITCPNGILLYIDEIQYFNKKQQQSLLEFTENGKITLIASTTENPYFYVYGALLSRAQVFEFKTISKNEIKKAIKRGIKFLEKENSTKISISKELIDKISCNASGDVRKAINMLEMCFLSSKTSGGETTIESEKIINELTNSCFHSYNSTGDDHFDLISAFQKSLRGSDPNAAIYYLARLLEAGELMIACRRLLICACEDVGLAYPGIFSQVKSLVDIALQVGMPEARIPLADGVILVAMSPKSNSAYQAINTALKDIRNGNVFMPPRHLQNIHCDGQEIKKDNLQTYKYPHDFKNHWTPQQYLPDEIKNAKYYYPQENKNETAFENYRKKITGQKLKKNEAH